MLNSEREVTSAHHRQSEWNSRPPLPSSAASRRLDSGDIDLLHRHHCLKGAFCLCTTSRKCIGQRAWSDLPGEAPAVFAPTARAFLAAIADDRVPITVRFFLILRRDLEGEGLVVPERWATVETETGNAQDAPPSRHRPPCRSDSRQVPCGRRSPHCSEMCGVEPRRAKCVLVEPEADRVFRFHLCVSTWRNLVRTVLRKSFFAENTNWHGKAYAQVQPSSWQDAPPFGVRPSSRSKMIW
jgi:hypothetical protein